MNYTAHVFASSPKDPHSPILLDATRPSRCILWLEYISTVKRTAVGLRKVGLADQEAVGLLSYNDIYYYLLGDGAIAAGATFAGIPTFVKPTELATAITAAGLKWLFVAPEFLELVMVTADSIGFPAERVMVFDPPGLEPYTGSQQGFSKLINNADESLFQNANQGKDPKAQISHQLFTSGTTGAVKSAQVSHTVQLDRMSYAMAQTSSNKERTLQTIGMYHASGLVSHCGALSGAGPLYVSKLTDASTIVDMIGSLKITRAMLTPRIMEEVVGNTDGLPNATAALKSLRHVRFGGSPTSADLVRAFKNMLPSEASLWITYGCTESLRVASAPIDEKWSEGCVGVPWSDVEVKIVNPATFEAVTAGSSGEICVRSASTFNGYYQAPAANESAFLPGERGWFRTGDKGCFHPTASELFITGRFKEIFKVNYEEVSPREVENELLKHGSVAEAFITSTEARDNNRDRECMAYIVRKKDTRLTAQEVVDFVASKLAHHKAPTGGVIFCETIPRGAMGKVLKKALVDVQALYGSSRFLSITA